MLSFGIIFSAVYFFCRFAFMNRLIYILLLIPLIGTAQVNLLPSIGLIQEPDDFDSICMITPRAQGNPWSTINVGDTMADFKLYDINGDSIILSDVLNSGKRVLMISGSYTCPIFRDHMTDLNAVSAQFSNDIACFVVYTVEAHPTGSPMPYSGNVNPTNPPYSQPQTYAQRKLNLLDMMNGVGTGSYIPVPISVPIYIDGVCNEWWNYYNGPNNAYLIDTNGILFAFHSWFNNSNPPNGQPNNIWCDIDSLLSINSGGCNQVTTLNGAFDFQLNSTSSVPAFGNPGDIIDVFGKIINTSNDGVKVEVERVMNNLPSNTWTSSMCLGACLPSTQDTVSAIIPANDTLDFDLHFYTDLMMLGPDTGKVRIKFKNANGNQSTITQNYRAITYAHTTDLPIIKDFRKIKSNWNLLGQKERRRAHNIQIIIYADGTVKKNIIIE